MTYRSDSGFSAAGLVAILAGLAGVAVLVVAAVRFAGMVEGSDDEAPTPPVAMVSTTVATAATTISTPSPQSTLQPGRFVTVSDDSGSISVEVPEDWIDVLGSGWVVDGEQVGPSVTAAPNVDAWYSTWGTPGVFLGVSTTGLEPEVGDFSGICSTGETDERAVGALSGTLQSWSRCGDEGSDFYVFVGGPADASFGLIVQLVSTDGTGLDTLDHVMATFSYAP